MNHGMIMTSSRHNVSRVLMSSYYRLNTTYRHPDMIMTSSLHNVQAGQCERAKDAYERDQKTLKCAHQELEKRITEYDYCVGECKPETLLKVSVFLFKRFRIFSVLGQVRNFKPTQLLLLRSQDRRIATLPHTFREGLT